MKKDDSSKLEKSVENRNRRVKRSASLFMLSNVAVDDSVAQGVEQNEAGDIGNQAPKKRLHTSLPLSFIATSEGSEEMPKLELLPSASMNFGINSDYGFEAESANDEIINESLEANFTSPGPRAPIRQASSRSLFQFVDDLAVKDKFMDLEPSEIEKYFGDTEQEKSSPSSSPKASSSRIETVKKNIADKEKSL